jgi:hypothetical protein
VKRLMPVVAAALSLAAPASAKEMLGVQLCGSSGCATEKGPQLGGALPEGPGGPFTTGDPAAAPAEPDPWYRLTGLVGDHGKVYGRVGLYYVPRADVLVFPGQGGQTTTWQHATPAVHALLARLVAKVDPFAAPKLTRVSLNGEAADDPQSYLSLYTVGGKATTYPQDAQSTQIVLETAKRTPWTDGNNLVLYATSNLLVRDGQIVSIPPDVASRVAAGRSLDVGRSFPWLAALVAAGVLALVAASMLLARRLRVAASPVPQA